MPLLAPFEVTYYTIDIDEFHTILQEHLQVSFPLFLDESLPYRSKHTIHVNLAQYNEPTRSEVEAFLARVTHASSTDRLSCTMVWFLFHELAQRDILPEGDYLLTIEPKEKRVERALFVEEITIEDPETHAPVEMSVYKTLGGGIVAIDTSYLAQFRDIVPSPFDDHILLDLREDEVTPPSSPEDSALRSTSVDAGYRATDGLI